MGKKEAKSYARALLNRGFTKDSARSIMLSRGFSEQEIRNGLTSAEKPEKHINLTTLLLIAVISMVILIPTVIILTKDQILTESEDYYDQSSQKQTQQDNTQPTQQTEEFKCTIDDECFSSEACINNNCVKLHCPPCQEPYQHQCTEISCDDDNPCTNDYCQDNQCTHVPVQDCNQGQNISDSQDECLTNYDCFDNDPSTLDKCISSSPELPKQCTYTPIACLNDDGVCPKNCTMLTDNDCIEVCGNNITEGYEKCDGPDCPKTLQDCNDNNTCTEETILGSATLCTAECVNTPIAQCISNDYCCPQGCTYSLDNDCEPSSTLLATGQFTSVQRPTTGDLELKWFENDIHKIIFKETFAISNVQLEPELKIYLAKEPIVTTKQDLDSGNIEIEELQELAGEQEYEILTFINNIQDYQSIVIFHTTLNSVYAYATLSYQ